MTLLLDRQPKPVQSPDETDAEHRNRDTMLALALALWDDHTPSAFRGLPSGEGWEFDPTTQTYTSSSGTKIRGPAIGNLVDAFGTSVEIEIEQASSDMLGEYEKATPSDRKDLLDKWLVFMLMTLQGEYLAGAAIGVGGFDEMQEEDWQVVEGAAQTSSTPGTGLTDAESRLYEFAKEIEGDTLSDKQVVARAGSYGVSVYPIYETTRRNSHKRAEEPIPDDEQIGPEFEAENGQKIPDAPTTRKLFTMERNILDPASEHCKDSDLPGCITETKKGWVPIGTLSNPGLRTCSTRCRCQLQFKRGP